MKLVRDARTLKTKSICSLKVAMSAFNSYDDEGRITMVLMNLQHACGSQKIRCFSDNAVTKMKEALEHVNMDQLWADRPR